MFCASRVLRRDLSQQLRRRMLATIMAPQLPPFPTAAVRQPAASLSIKHQAAFLGRCSPTVPPLGRVRASQLHRHPFTPSQSVSQSFNHSIARACTARRKPAPAGELELPLEPRIMSRT